MTDYSAKARLKQLQAKRDELKKTPLRKLPELDLPQDDSGKVMDLLNDSQSMDAMLYAVQLEGQVKNEKLQGVFPAMSWFDALDAAQRSQVIDYINSMLGKYDLVLVWFSRGSQRGYMFERLSSPVASR